MKDNNEFNIKSFVIRSGRTTKSQRRALLEYKDIYSIDYKINMKNRVVDFFNNNPLIVEIGFGMGDSLVNMAEKNPHYNYLGIEIYEPGLGNILKLIHAKKIRNLLIMKHDAFEIFQTNFISNCSLKGINVFFPDPWPKKKHRKRRLINRRFIDLISEKLLYNGFFHFVSDDEDYANSVFEILVVNKKFILNKTDCHHQRFLTKFEARAQLLNHKISEFVFYKN